MLELEGDGQLSGIRKVGGRTQVRLWNPRADRSAVERVGDQRVELGPARIETVDLPAETG